MTAAAPTIAPDPARAEHPLGDHLARRLTVERHGDALILIQAGARQPRPEDWRDRLLESLRAIPGVAAVGAKRLAPDGRLHSMGEFIVHPKGFHHLGRGLDAAAYRFPEEVDAVCGGVMAVRADAIGRTRMHEPSGARAKSEENGLGDLATLDLCLAIRRSGFRIVVIPHVTVEDSSSPRPTEVEREAFRVKWGFDWRAADLDAVRARHAGTGLQWNIRYHASPLAFEKYQQRPALHWANYRSVEPYRKRADHLVSLVRRATPPRGRVLDLGCGDGLFSFLIGRLGHEVIGIDPEEAALAQAEAQCAAAIGRTRPPDNPPAPFTPTKQMDDDAARDQPRTPRFIRASAESLPLEACSIDTIAMFDVIEHLPNPVAVLREVQRVLRRGGKLVLSTPAWQFGASSDPCYHICEYTLEELTGQIEAATSLRVAETGQIGGVYRDLLVIAQERPTPGDSAPSRPAP
jgi:SAM-dependent methyltransferase